MHRHEGGEPESGRDYAADKGVGIGQGPVFGEGYGPLEAKFLNQGAEPDNGDVESHFTAEGVDARSQVVHRREFT